MKLYDVRAEKRNGEYVNRMTVEETALDSFKAKIQRNFKNPLVFIISDSGVEKAKNTNHFIAVYTNSGIEYFYEVKDC